MSGLPGAWKPGSPSPSSTFNREESNPNKPQDNSNATNPQTPSKKKLSGSTMNMRFMQRRRESDEAATRKRKADDEDQARYEPFNNEFTTQTKKNMCTPTATQVAPLFIIANGWDMHGPDIIGRRSFGGFNKAVAETWSAALAHYRQNSNISNNKATISDEELLNRYKKYIMCGDDDSRKRRSSQPRPIGNLDANRKRKKSV